MLSFSSLGHSCCLLFSQKICNGDNEILVFSRVNFQVAVGSNIQRYSLEAINLSNLLIFGIVDEAGIVERTAWN